MIRRISTSIPIFALALSLLPFSSAVAHQQLLSSEPPEGAILTAAPSEVRLTFNQAVEPALAQMRLLGPAGEVRLGARRVPADEPTVFVATITGALSAGEYTVQWLVTGDDGHPVRGETRFTIARGAAGLAARSAGDDGSGAVIDGPGAGSETNQSEGGAASENEDGLSAASPFYGLVRWLTFTGIVVVTGAVSFSLLLIPGMERHGPPPSGAVERARARAAGVGLIAAITLGVALILRLVAQGAAMSAPGGTATGDVMVAMITRTVWGWGWLLQAAALAVATTGFWLARRTRSSGWGLAAVGTLALALTPALSGHAVATSLLAVITDWLHVLAAGGWLGTLLLMLVVGIPLLLERAESRRADAASLLSAFSPLALVFAGILTLTGVYAAWLHLPSVSALWSSAYGQTLLLKLAALTVVFAAGAYNWRRARPAAESTSDLRPLKRSASAEIAMGALVLAVTAALVATPPPGERPETGSGPEKSPILADHATVTP